MVRSFRRPVISCIFRLLLWQVWLGLRQREIQHSVFAQLDGYVARIGNFECITEASRLRAWRSLPRPEEANSTVVPC